MKFNQDVTINQIINNKLNGLEYDFVIAQLCVLNNKPYQEVKDGIDLLISGKFLQINDSNEIFIDSIPKKEYDYDKFLAKRNRKTSNKTKSKIIDGKIQGTRSKFAFFIPFDSSFDDVFIHEKNLNTALNGDFVSVEMFKGKRGVEGRVVTILERGQNKIIGKINLSKTGATVVSDDVKFGRDVFVPVSKTFGASDGDKVVVKIDKYYADRTEGQVVEVLGKPNEIETEVLSIIRSYNLYEDFPKKVEAFAEHIPSEVDKEKYKNRLDLTRELIFTIDGEDARDLDDAISLKENEDGTLVLGVHIADVGEYVKFNSVIDNEAFKRATSVYFPSLVLPMLPKQLSNGICSLNEMVNRLALSVFLTYNEKADVIDYSIKETIIKSKKRFTYTEVDKVLQNDKEALNRNKVFVETLQKMNVLSKKLIKLREKRGAIDFDIPEVKISLNDLGDVLNVDKRERNDSHKLIESFMIAANEVIAEHFSKAKMPFVYRIHEKPDSEKILNFFNFVKTFGLKVFTKPDNVKPKDLQTILAQIPDDDVKYVVNKICLRSLKKAKYYQECLGHFGLASTFYCHFTSPIRRYPDLTIHRIIKDYLRHELKGNNFIATKHFVNSSSKVSSDREVVAERAERDVDDLYKTFYMQHHLAEEFEGKISSVTAFGVYVELDNTVEGLVRLEDLPADKYNFIESEYRLVGTQHEYKIGQKLKVKAVRADILARDIDFILS